MMTQTTSDVELITILENEFEPPCEHFEHGEGTHRERHDVGPARFELVMPCGRAFKVCAQFVAWLDADGTITCSRNKGEKHDKHSIVWLPL